MPEIKVPAASEQIFESGIEFEATNEASEPQSGEPAQPGQPEAAVQTTTLEFTATDNWTATVDDTKASSWVSIVPVSGGAGDVTMTVTAQPNTTPNPRRAKVTIKCGTAIKSFIISQAAAKPVYINVTEITLNPETLNLAEGESANITATVKPDNATDKSVTWSTSNASVATVNDGKVTAVKEGSATITAMAGNKEATCEVTVSKQIIFVTGIELGKTSLNLAVGDSYVLAVLVSPDNATDKSYTLASTNNQIATVDAAGKVTAVSAGTVTITATTTDGGFIAACEVTVFVPVTPVASVTLDKNDLALTKGQTAALTATVKPDDATNKTVSWTSSDETVATVKDGEVTAIKSGTATITAMAENQTATCQVTVTNPAVKLELDRYDLTLTEGETAQLVATVEPADADELPVKWKSSDTSVATVDDSGKVTAIKDGSARITATCGSFWANCEVTVRKKTIDVTGVALNNRTISLIEGETASLVATVSPANATDKSVIWSTSDASVAEVDNNGNVYANTAGSAVITVTTNDGGKSATCEVTVISLEVPVVDIYLNPTSLTLTKGASESLIAIVEPYDATNPLVFWASSDDSVATVREGTVTAIKSGKATIYASAEDKTATCEVTVITPVTGISLDCSGNALIEGESFTLKATVEPADADDKTVTWSSSDPGVATVDASGKVTAKTEGSATITAACGAFTATCAVTVAKQIIAVTGVELSNTQLSLTEGETGSLVATVKPDDATNKTVTWSSSNTAVATVVDGVVTAVKAGTATITAACGNFLATCAVTVEAPFVPVTSISLNKTELSMQEGEWYTLTVTFNPSNATDKSVNWSTSNASVAKLIGPGKIEAGKPGTATITAECGGKTATCAVTVAAPPVQITGIALDPDNLEFYVGESATVNVVYSPEDATPEPVSWTWYGTSYATIEEGETSCTLTATASGGAYLYAQYGSYRVGCQVTIRERPVQRTVTVSPTSMTIDPGEEFVLNVTVDPPLGSGEKLYFSSSDEDVVKVDIFDGHGWGVKPGTCRIQVSCPGAEEVYCDVTVTDHYEVSYFIINPTLFYVAKGATYAMEWSIYPEEASGTPISWSSSDPAIATIDASGVITGISLGTVTITAVCGGKTATSEVTIYEGGGGEEPPIDDPFRLDKDEITLAVGATYTLTVTKYPEGTGADDVFWGSDNWEVATVQDGVVTAHTTGVAIIVARIGDYETYCTVKVPLSGGGSGGLDPVTDEPLN